MKDKIADYMVKCSKCNKTFGVTVYLQSRKFSYWEYIICPYCHEFRGKGSLRVEYKCYKMDEVNKA